MSKVTITLNGRPFTIGCEEGQQAYLKSLAAHLDGHVQELADKVGQIGELRLLLMAALIVADEYRESQTKLEALQNGSGASDSSAAQQDSQRKAERERMAQALNTLAGRLEAIAHPDAL